MCVREREGERGRKRQTDRVRAWDRQTEQEGQRKRETERQREGEYRWTDKHMERATMHTARDRDTERPMEDIITESKLSKHILSKKSLTELQVTCFLYFLLPKYVKNHCFHLKFCHCIIWVSNNLDQRLGLTFV